MSLDNDRPQRTMSAMTEEHKAAFFWNREGAGWEALCLAADALISAVIATVVSFIVGALGFESNAYRWGFLLCLSFTTISFFIFRKSIAEKPQNVFLCFLLTFTCLSSVAYGVNEVGWDQGNHFYFMLEYADVDRTDDLSVSEEAMVFRSDLSDEAADDKPMVNIEDRVLLNKDIDEIDDREAELDRFDDEYRKGGAEPTRVHGSLKNIYKRIASIPGSITYYILDLFDLSFTLKFIVSHLVYALIYSFALFFGMRKLRSGKMIFAVVSLFPTMLFLASTYSYDYWVNAFSMLGTAYLVGILQRPHEKISAHDALIMLGSFLIGFGPKAIYFPLILICLLVPKSKFSTVKQSRLYRLAVVSALLIVLSSFAIPYFITEGPGLGEVQHMGSEVNSVEQMKFILSNPIEYAGVLLSFLCSYLSPTSSSGYITLCGYLKHCSPVVWISILGLVLFTCITDKKKCDASVNTWPNRIAVTAISIATISLVATALYVSYNPIASESIKGCQARYLLPLVFAFLIFIGPKKVERFHFGESTLYNGSILGLMMMFNYIGIWQTYIGLLV